MPRLAWTRPEGTGRNYFLSPRYNPLNPSTPFRNICLVFLSHSTNYFNVFSFLSIFRCILDDQFSVYTHLIKSSPHIEVFHHPEIGMIPTVSSQSETRNIHLRDWRNTLFEGQQFGRFTDVKKYNWFGNNPTLTISPSRMQSPVSLSIFREFVTHCFTKTHQLV
jgi:hypothetical protein